VLIQLVLGQLKIVLDFGVVIAYNGTSKGERMRYPADFTSELRRKPICGVLSIAIIARVSFKQATDTVKKNLMPHQKRHGGKTYHEQRMNSLRALGVTFREVPVYSRMTLRRVVEDHCRPDKLYMINTSRHVVTVKNGIVVDQQEVNPIATHGARRCFVRNITEVVN
jgi:hypothetical protein